MRVHHHPAQTIRSGLLAVALLAVTLLAVPSAASANSGQEAMFQDDNKLVYNTPEGTAETMDTLQALGVDRIRVSVFWVIVAPDADSPTKPANFDASDPAAYPPGNWTRYDRIVRLARERHIAVNFDVTSPAPNWATGNAPRADIDKTFDPDPKEYGAFVHALGVRYSGAYSDVGVGGPLLPRVRYWSIWNEPNQPGWLTPQWAKDPRGKNAMVETAPSIYRSLVDAAWTALQQTQHGKDTILIGETAPKGLINLKGTTRAIDALRFIRQMYCLDSHLQLYKGSSAQLRGCPVGDGARQKFVAAHPGLFKASGYAHHPYELIFSPHTKPKHSDWVTIANLPDLSKLLRRIYQRYSQPMPGGKKNVPLYLTEFGYQTNPPDPLAVSPNKQAAWNTEAEYRAYRDPNVRTLNQFLLVDDNPVPGIPKSDPAAWATFQTGLVNLDGSKKPSYRAYEMGMYLPSRSADSKRHLRVWGIARVTPDHQRVKISVQTRTNSKHSKYRTIGTLKTNGRRGYVNGRVSVRQSGRVRLRWKAPSGKVFASRSVAFRLKK